MIDSVFQHLSDDSPGPNELEAGVSEIFGRLKGLGIVELAKAFPPCRNQEVSTNPSQYAYFSRVSSDAQTVSARVEHASILILGLGGLGSVVLQHLVGAGIKRFTLVDHDFVEESNLGRQFIHSLETLGSSKLESAVRYIEQRVNGAQIQPIVRQLRNSEDVDAVLKLAGHLDSAAVCIDSPPVTAFDVCATGLWDAAIPFIHGGLMTQSGFFGPLFALKHGTAHPSLFALGDAKRAGIHDACFAPYNTVIGAYMAAELTHHLAGLHHLINYTDRTFVDWYRRREVAIKPSSLAWAKSETETC
ncbi:MAG: HesA/MoeB/ThiF family protein [Candidatus Dormibacteraceae bacterium]